MAKESSEGGLLKKKSVDHNKKRIENLSKANAVKEKVIHLDQLEFLPIFPYSELLIWMLPAPNVTDHSYFVSVYLKIFIAHSLLLYCRLEDYYYYFFLLFFFFFFLMLRNPRSATHRSTVVFTKLCLPPDMSGKNSFDLVKIP